MIDNAKKGDMIVIDARSFLQYKSGHIRSATNVDWTRNLENSIFKNKEELSKIYSKIPKNAQIVTYCQGGYRAANAFLALKILGYKNVKMWIVGRMGEYA